jgi:hypothetical protein
VQAIVGGRLHQSSFEKLPGSGLKPYRVFVDNENALAGCYITM